jgi:hypothetical protein
MAKLDDTDAEHLHIFRLPRSRFSFVTEFRICLDGTIERRTVNEDGSRVKDSLGEWQKIDPEGVEMSRRAIPALDEWLTSLNWRSRS